MRAFRYRLQPLLELREYHEREWEIKLGRAAGRCAKIRSEIERLERERRELGARERTGKIEISELAAENLYRIRLTTKIESLTEELAQAERERQTIQASYFEASRDKKIIEKLKERKADEYRLERLQAEAKTIDEIAGAGPARARIRGTEDSPDRA
jgi:flagellar FliJ protein